MVLLKELFLEKTKAKDYYETRNGDYVVQHKNQYYLTCRTEEQAIDSVELLQQCDWDKDMIPFVKKACGVYRKSKLNTTGFYRLQIRKNKNLKTGFMYVYEYQEENKRKKFSSKKLSKLRRKVKKHNQLWIPLTEDAEMTDKILENMGG